MVVLAVGTAALPAQAERTDSSRVASVTVQATSARPAKVVSSVATDDPVFFITIDDGGVRDQSALEYVRRHRLPVTTFLTSSVVQGNWDYFAKMSRYDAVQNHTMTHKALSLSSTNLDYEICYTQRYFRRNLGEKPWLLRPPYGAGWMAPYGRTREITSVAGGCGVTRVVLWNVVVESDSSVQFAGTPYQPGDIVLLHYNANLKDNLRTIVAAYAARGLTPARLSEYLRAPTR